VATRKSNIVKLPVNPSVQVPQTQPPPMTEEQKLDMLRKYPPGQLAQWYITTRDERDAAREEMEKASARMELIGRIIFEKMEELKQDGFTTKGQVVYEYTLTTHRVTDRQALKTLILSDPEKYLDLLEMRAADEGVKNYMLEYCYVDDAGEPMHDDNGNPIPAPPDGVEVFRHRKLGVKKK